MTDRLRSGFFGIPRCFSNKCK